MITILNKSEIQELKVLEDKIFDKSNFPLSLKAIKYNQSKNLFLIFKIENNIVGYILTFVRAKSARIYSIGVNQDFRGQNIGSQLIKTVIEIVKSKNIKIIRLEVRVDNIQAIELYKKFGFIIKKMLKSYYDDGCDGYKMELNIEESFQECHG